MEHFIYYPFTHVRRTSPEVTEQNLKYMYSSTRCLETLSSSRCSDSVHFHSLENQKQDLVHYHTHLSCIQIYAN